MVIRQYSSCIGCSKRILFRLQFGIVSEVLLDISCPSCGIRIYGTFNHTEREYKLVNAETIADFEPDLSIPEFTIPISTELPIHRSLYGLSKILLSPFMIFLEEFGFEDKFKFDAVIGKFEQIVGSIDKNESILHDYILQNKYREYLTFYKNKINPNIKILNTDLKDVIHISNKYWQKYFHIYAEVTSSTIIETIQLVQKNDQKLVSVFKNELENNISLEEEYKKGYSLLVKYESMIRILYPTIPFFISKENNNKINSFILTTITLDSLKGLYIELFEYISRNTCILFGYMNVKNRKNHNDFNLPSGQNMEDFIFLEHGKKLEIIEKDIDLNYYYFNYLDNKLKNSLSHFKYKYNYIDQTIECFPHNDKRRKDVVYNYTLLDVAVKTHALFIRTFDNLKFIESLLRA